MKNMMFIFLMISLLAGCSSAPPMSPQDMRNVPVVPHHTFDNPQTTAAKMISPLTY